MNIKLLRATPDPEELVCLAARNDYRSEGVAGYTFEEVMESVNPDERFEPYKKLLTEKQVDDPVLEAKKRTLLDHLMESGHWGPFEHPQATVALEGVTRVLMAQITRHRHFTFDVMSLRYVGLDGIDSDDRDELGEHFQYPEFRGEDFDVDREGVHEIEDPEYVDKDYKAAYSSAAHWYESLLDRGVPQEQARKVLPMGTKVNIVVSGNARAWMHILNVRTKANVQGETRRAAEAIFKELKGWMPYTFEKYDEDVLPLKLNP